MKNIVNDQKTEAGLRYVHLKLEATTFALRDNRHLHSPINEKLLHFVLCFLPVIFKCNNKYLNT